VRCVLCGKEYKKDVTDTHLKSHGMTRKGLDEKASILSESVWEFYWSHPGLQEKFPDPLAAEGIEGRMTFQEWISLPKVMEKHPEITG